MLRASNFKQKETYLQTNASELLEISVDMRIPFISKVQIASLSWTIMLKQKSSQVKRLV